MNEDYDWVDELNRCIEANDFSLGDLEHYRNEEEYFVEPEEPMSFSGTQVITSTAVPGNAIYFLGSPTTVQGITYQEITRSTEPTWRSSTW